MLQNGLILLWFIIYYCIYKQYKKGCMPSDPYLKIVVTKVNKIFTQNKTFYGELDILNSNRDLLTNSLSHLTVLIRLIKKLYMFA